MAGADRRHDVLIAGAGIGGLTAALALSRVGVRVIVVERAAELTSLGAGLQLSPNATRVLRTLEVIDAVAAVASRPDGIRVREARSGRTLSYVPLGDAEARWGAPYFVVRRADLQRVLATAVAAEPAIELRLGTALAGFGTTPGGVLSTLRYGLLTHTLETDALIGADGIRSIVRARLVGGAIGAPQETGRLAWRTLVDAASLRSPPPTGETGLWLGRDAHLVHYPVAGGRLINVVAITRDDGADPDSTWAQLGDASVIAQRVSGWHADALALVANAASWTTWPLHDRAPLGAWNAGPVALLGDAAHPILPFLAQGAAQAIEDAAMLADAFAQPSPIPDRLDRYSRARLARATRVQETSRRLGRIYHLSGLKAVGRNAAMSLLGGRRLAARYDWLYGA